MNRQRILLFIATTKSIVYSFSKIQKCKIILNKQLQLVTKIYRYQVITNQLIFTTKTLHNCCYPPHIPAILTPPNPAIPNPSAMLLNAQNAIFIAAKLTPSYTFLKSRIRKLLNGKAVSTSRSTPG